MVNGIIICVSGVQVPPPLPNIPQIYNKNNILSHIGAFTLTSEKSVTHLCYCEVWDLGIKSKRI